MALWQLELQPRASDGYIIVFCILLCVLIFKFKSSKRRLPPGPTKWPFIGNLLSIPKDYAWEVYANWSKKYGSYFTFYYDSCFGHAYHEQHVESDILHLNVLGTSMIILNSYKSAREVLEKRSASSR